MLTLGMRPCVVLVDLIMPVMDGFDLHKRIGAEPELRMIPLIGLTGHEGLRRSALSEGFAEAFLKPGNIDELFAFIGDHCPASATSGPKRQRA